MLNSPPAEKAKKKVKGGGGAYVLGFKGWRGCVRTAMNGAGGGVGDCSANRRRQRRAPIRWERKPRRAPEYLQVLSTGVRCSAAAARACRRTKFIQMGGQLTATASTVAYASHSWQITHESVAIATLSERIHRETLFLTQLINPQTNGVLRHLPRIFLKGCQAAATQPQRRSATAP